jgi:hypothetical protein
VRRVAAAVAAVALAAAPAAFADTSTDGYVAKVKSIEPTVSGLELDVEADGHVVLTAPAGHTIVVYGYEEEPYLRFSRGKVYDNAVSSTTAVNEPSEAPSTPSDSAPARWEQIATGRTHEWNDRRVARQRWTIRGSLDGRGFVVTGGLVRAGGGLGRWLFVAVAVAALLGAASLAVAGSRRRRGAAARANEPT